MLKLLIIDDEIITREGLIERYPWKDLGIGSISQAEDGLSAIEIAEEFPPDIILADIRMPRMNGIEMAYKLRQINPKCKIIFMSGYSDKEYLKSAINLKVITYIEKPIEREVLINAITEAVTLCNEEENVRQQELSRVAYINSTTNDLFLVILIQIVQGSRYKEDQPSGIPDYKCEQIRELFASSALKHTVSMKGNNCVMIQLSIDSDKEDSLKPQNILPILSPLPDIIKGREYFVSMGKIMRGLNNVHESYVSASNALQKSFYYNYGSVICYKEDNSAPYDIKEELVKRFSDFLREENEKEAELLIEQLFLALGSHQNTLVLQSRNIYYKLLLQLFTISKTYNLDIFTDEKEADLFGSIFSEHFILCDINKYVLSKTVKFFEALRDKKTYASTVADIIRFIKNNYSNEQLSLEHISRHTLLSTAYMCVIFKQETSETINQFITRYRIDKAKELLKYKLLKVNDVASKVGYKDGKYFAKIFRKSTGFTPSEYREKCHI